jgi:phthiodiolone/phenolphthiodiolone dimycocerosates ketoreductase
MTRDVQTAVHYWPSRFQRPQAAAEFAKRLEAAPGVDWFNTWDQLVSFLPQALWRPDVAPMAALATDSDSYYNAAMIAMLAANATTELHITTTLDSVRIGPAELLQQMLTLAATTPARVALQLGAGELKQCKPFGYKRSQGLSRMEDILQIVRKLLGTEGLISHEGKYWTYSDAWIGNHYPKLPEIWALGGGPKLIDIATSYADGFMSMAPSAFWEPEQWGAQVQQIRAELERKDRDPDAFVNGFWPLVVVYDSDEMRERLFNSGIIKWMAAGWGRLHHGDWAKEGIELIFPEDWHYAMRLLPHAMSRAEVDEIVAKVTPEMIEKSFFLGTPAEVAAQLRPYVEAGADFMAVGDLSGAALGPEDTEHCLQLTIEACAHLKGVGVAA